MKKGYESIPSNESNLSVPRSGFRLDQKTILAIATALLLIVGVFYATQTYDVEKIPEVVVLPPDEQVDVMVRPKCVSYNANKVITVVQTSMKTPDHQWAPIPCEKAQNDKVVELNSFGLPDAILQTNLSHIVFEHSKIKGFGGAFTEAAALNFNQLSIKGKETVMELLFGKTGLGYTVGRFPINSCDFSVKSYSFDETVDDFDLEDFDTGVQHDVKSGMVDMALRAVSTLRQAWSDGADDGEMFLYASPWSPPAWMKTPTFHWEQNETFASMTGSALPNCLKDGVGPDSEYAKTWALYFSKFLTAYKNLGLSLSAVTVQNEPEFPAPWEACAYDPETQHDFVAHHLGPRLRKDHPDVKILVFDHNKDHINQWVKTLLNESSQAKPYIAGTAYHWYAGGMDRLLDGALGIPNMHRLQDQLSNYGLLSDHIVLGSESCHCPTTGYAGGNIEIYWARAERYAHTILADLAAGSHGWVEWNFILDGIGGPNHLNNLCESTILAVPHRAVGMADDYPPLPPFEKQKPFGNVSLGDGRTREELNALGFPAKYLDAGIAVQPIYFYMGHISRHVRPGSYAVPGLVQESLSNSSKIFRPANSVVMGGGQNDLARNGIELTVWPCEGSTRQQFKWNIDDMKHIQVYGHDWLGNPTTSCIGREPDVDLHGLRLEECDKNHAGSFDILYLVDDPESRFIIKLLNPVKKRKRDECLVIVELHNGGGAYGLRGGGQISLGDCESEAAKWSLDHQSGEASSTYFGDPVCLTTGWPFLQMGAFQTPSGENTVVILNEANDPANYVLKDGDAVLLTSSIPARSIQTILIG